MNHNRLKFKSLLLVSSWLMGRVLDWRLSQPGFDPSYGNLVCQATLMSSVRTKQICLWMTIYIYIYYVLILSMYLDLFIPISAPLYRSIYLTFDSYLSISAFSIFISILASLIPSQYKSIYLLSFINTNNR